MMDATAIIIEANDVARSVEEARAALQRQDWEEAERALAETQDRIGRILREISFQKERRQPNRMRAETQQSPSRFISGRRASASLGRKCGIALAGLKTLIPITLRLRNRAGTPSAAASHIRDFLICAAAWQVFHSEE
jgi:hypothetical protein